MELIMAIAIVCTTACIIGLAIVVGILTARASIKQGIEARRADQPIRPMAGTETNPGAQNTQINREDRIASQDRNAP